MKCVRATAFVRAFSRARSFSWQLTSNSTGNNIGAAAVSSTSIIVLIVYIVVWYNARGIIRVVSYIEY